MNRSLTSLFAALEALLVVGIGIGIPLVPLTFMWAFQYGLQLDWSVFWRASVDFWLVGHGADVTLSLDPLTAASTGLPAAGTPFVVSIAALGVGLLTLLLAVRAGRRIAETPYVKLGSIVAVVVIGVLSFGATLSSLHEFARPSLWQGSLLPTFVFATGLCLGLWLAERRLRRMPGREVTRGMLGTWWDAQPVRERGVLSQSLRGGAAAAMIVVSVSSLLLAVMILTNYAQVIALYEGIHSDVLGGVAVTLAELAFLPNFVMWTASWLVGPGFAIGAGSSVGPLGTSLGPLPAVPILGALPTGDFAFGFLGLLVPIVAAFLVGAAIRPAVLRTIEADVIVTGRGAVDSGEADSGRAGSGATRIGAAGSFSSGSGSGSGSGEPGGIATGGARDHSSLSRLVLTGVGIGVVGGLLLGLLAWVSGGAAGPGRLAEVGPDALMVGLFAALEFGVAATIGLLVSRPARAT